MYCSLKHLSMCFSYFFAFDSVRKVHDANFSWLKAAFLFFFNSVYQSPVPMAPLKVTLPNSIFIKTKNRIRLQICVPMMHILAYLNSFFVMVVQLFLIRKDFDWLVRRLVLPECCQTEEAGAQAGSPADPGLAGSGG